MAVIYKDITFDKIRRGICEEGDIFGYCKYATEGGVKDAILANPSLVNDKLGILKLAKVDDKVVGRILFYPTRMKIEENITFAMTASSLVVNDDFRKEDIGTEFVMTPFSDSNNEHLLYAGISKMAYPIYKVMRFNLLDFPNKVQPRNTRFIFQMMGLNGVILSIFSFLGNCLLKPFVRLLDFIALRSTNKFEVKKMRIVPEWAEAIVLNDKHKYAELHDRAWMQWTLDYNFFKSEFDKQGFYAVYKGSNPVGFFMVKERQLCIESRKIDRMVFASIYEWGCIDEKSLSESDIFKLAFSVYSKDVDIVSYSSSNASLMNALTKFLFIRNGDTHIVYKNLKNNCKDAKDIKNWRIRTGYCDVPFY